VGQCIIAHAIYMTFVSASNSSSCIASSRSPNILDDKLIALITDLVRATISGDIIDVLRNKLDCGTILNRSHSCEVCPYTSVFELAPTSVV